MKLINVPEINRWAKGTWVWNGKRFETLKEAKAFLDNAVLETPLYTLITEYEGYDYIAHYDRNGEIASIVEIAPDETSYHRYHYTKPRRVAYSDTEKKLVYLDEVAILAPAG